MKPKGIPCVLWFSSLLNSKAWVFWSSLRTKAHHVYLKRVGRSPQRLPPNRKLPVFVLDRPTAQSVLERSPRAWPLILQSKPSIVFSNSLRERLPDYLQGLKLGLKLELCRLNPKIKFNKLCGFQILFRTPKLSTAVSWYQSLSTRQGWCWLFFH